MSNLNEEGNADCTTRANFVNVPLLELSRSCQSILSTSHLGARHHFHGLNTEARIKKGQRIQHTLSAQHSNSQPADKLSSRAQQHELRLHHSYLHNYSPL
jgi:hypothetical protein